MSDNPALNDLAQRTFRGPKTSVYQQMLSQKLIKANQTPEPLHKIRYGCEAAFFCKNKEPLDMAKIQAINAVTQSLLNTEIPQADSNKPVVLAWSFPRTAENFKYHVAPWNQLTLRYHVWETELRREKHPQQWRRSSFTSRQSDIIEAENQYADYQGEVIKEIGDEINAMPAYAAFYQRTSALGRNSFNRMKAEFEGWAVPLMLEAMATMVDDIDPKVYAETLSTLYGQDPEE